MLGLLLPVVTGTTIQLMDEPSRKRSKSRNKKQKEGESPYLTRPQKDKFSAGRVIISVAKSDIDKIIVDAQWNDTMGHNLDYEMSLEEFQEIESSVDIGGRNSTIHAHAGQ